MDWIDLALNREKWRALVYAVMKFHLEDPGVDGRIILK
jgi:hypothetical protein